MCAEFLEAGGEKRRYKLADGQRGQWVETCERLLVRCGPIFWAGEFGARVLEVVGGVS